MARGLNAGAANCVVDCAEVRKGHRVMIVNEEGAVDPEVATAIQRTAEAQSATVGVVWAPLIPKDRPDDIPRHVLDAYQQTDVLIAHFPSLQREALHAHFPGETRVRVPNRALRSALLASDWARFPYSVQPAVSHSLDNLMVPGAKWRITSPSGTDINGVFAASNSTVSKAYFAQSDDNERARRNFPGGVNSPHASNEVNGIIVVDYLDHHPAVGHKEVKERLRLEINNNAVAGVTGGTMASGIREYMAARTAYLAPPDLPDARTRILRTAFDAMVNDPVFLAEAEKVHIDIAPVRGETISKLIDNMYASSPELVRAATAAMKRKDR